MSLRPTPRISNQLKEAKSATISPQTNTYRKLDLPPLKSQFIPHSANLSLELQVGKATKFSHKAIDYFNLTFFT